MGRDEDKAIAATGIFGLFMATVVGLFVWFMGEQKRQERQHQLDYRDGKDIQVALEAMQRLEHLRRSHLEAAEALVQSERQELERLQSLAGRERLIESYRASIAHLERHARQQGVLLCRTFYIRKTQQMHGHLVVAMRARPDLKRTHQITDEMSPVQAIRVYQQVEKDIQDLLSRLDTAMRLNDQVLDENIGHLPLPDVDESDPDSLLMRERELVAVRDEIRINIEQLRAKFELRVDETRYLRHASQHRDLESQAVRLGGEHVCGMTVIQAADEALDGLDELTDWILQEMAKMEVEMTCAAAELDAASLAGVDLQAETQAAQEVSRHLAGLRQASRRTTS